MAVPPAASFRCFPWVGTGGRAGRARGGWGGTAARPRRGQPARAGARWGVGVNPATPRRLHEEGVRRYGFHGLSYEYIAKTLPDVAPEIARARVIVAHLGSGASMCAIHGGRSVESTMGFTALDGLPMGTRTGQIDPGVVLYLMTAKGMSATAVQDFLYRDCGLKGLSGISNDMRELQESNDPRAAFAVDYFVYRVALHAGMLAAALQGLDAFVFTAGIGENSIGIRARIAQRLEWVWGSLDSARKARRARPK